MVSHCLVVIPACIAGVTRKLGWDTTEAVPREMQAQSGFQVIRLFPTDIRQPLESSHGACDS
jgi:hypothetical protein